VGDGFGLAESQYRRRLVFAKADFHGKPLARYSIRCADAEEESWIHNGRDFDPGAGNWREHRHLQRSSEPVTRPLPYPNPEQLVEIANAYFPQIPKAGQSRTIIRIGGGKTPASPRWAPTRKLCKGSTFLVMATHSAFRWPTPTREPPSPARAPTLRWNKLSEVEVCMNG
jgi:hypothetical protein